LMRKVVVCLSYVDMTFNLEVIILSCGDYVHIRTFENYLINSLSVTYPKLVDDIKREFVLSYTKLLISVNYKGWAWLGTYHNTWYIMASKL
jgi:hypothetical protein